MELMEIANLVNLFDLAREARLAADKEAANLKRLENELQDRLIRIMHDQDMHYVAGKYKRVKLNVTEKPIVEDWPAVYGYMVEHDATDLLQKRLHEGAVKDRVDNGEVIPGIAYVEINKLSIAKI